LSGPIGVVEYDLDWPERFRREADRIRAVLGDRVLQLEHAGSTSLPGLPAKPIIDMVLEVPDSADEAAYVPVLESAGYRVELPARPLCCGRPLYYYGMLDTAKRSLKHVLRDLGPSIRSGVPIIGMEPSCLAVFRYDLPSLFPDAQDPQRLSTPAMRGRLPPRARFGSFRGPKRWASARTSRFKRQAAMRRHPARCARHGVQGLGRQFGFEAEAAAGRVAGAQRSAGRRGALAHAEQAVPGARVRRARSVVADPQPQQVTVVAQLDVDGRAGGVPPGVGQGLLHDAVGGQLHARIEPGDRTGHDQPDDGTRGLAGLVDQAAELRQARLRIPVRPRARGNPA